MQLIIDLEVPEAEGGISRGVNLMSAAQYWFDEAKKIGQNPVELIVTDEEFRQILEAAGITKIPSDPEPEGLEEYEARRFKEKLGWFFKGFFNPFAKYKEQPAPSVSNEMVTFKLMGIRGRVEG